MEIGINTMSLTADILADLEYTAREMHTAGCSYFEAMSDWGARQETIDFYARLTGGHGGWCPDNIEQRLAVLKKYGMRIDGLFVFDECIEEQLDDLCAHCLKFGIKYIVFTFLQLESLDEVYSKIMTVKNAAHRLTPYGIQVLVHTHECDFNVFTDHDGTEKTIVELFLSNTTKAECMLELDTGWVFYAGVDVSRYLSENLDRIAVLHLKDIHADYKTMPHDKVSVACGTGVINFPEIFASIPAEKREDIRLVLDQDSSQDNILTDQAKSLAYIRQLINPR